MARDSTRELTTAIMRALNSAASYTMRVPGYNPEALIQAKGYKIISEMLHDPEVSSAVQLKSAAVLYKGAEIVGNVKRRTDPGFDESDRLAMFMRHVMGNIQDEAGDAQATEEILWQVLDGTFSGFSVSEIIYRLLPDGEYAGKLGLSRIATKAPEQIGFELDPYTLALRNITCYDGERYIWNVSPSRVIHFVHSPRHAAPYGIPDARAVYPHWWSRQLGNKLWAIAVEVFGAPFIVAKAPAGSFADVRAIASKVRQGEPPVFPHNVDVTVINEVLGATFPDFMDYHGRQIKQAILFQTLTTTEGGRSGSYALASVHASTQDLGFGYIRNNLANTIREQLFKRLVLLNFGPDAVQFTPELSLGVWDESDRLKFAQAVAVLVDKKVVHREEEWIRSTLNLPPATAEVASALDEAETHEREIAKKQTEKPQAESAEEPGGQEPRE